MRVLRWFALAALSYTTLAAKKPSDSPYSNFVAKQSSSPIELDEQAYYDLTSTPRDYTAAIFLTARDAKFACTLCRATEPEWITVANSWRKADRKGDHRMIFASLDFVPGRKVFMQLQLQTAPILLLFPPTIGPNASPDGQPQRLDFLGPQNAEQMNGWITRHLPAGDYPSIVRPINYGRLAASFTILIGIFTLGTVIYPYVLPVIQNRNIWAGVCLILVLLFTSGQMFNHIRKVPYVAGDGRGGITYMAGGFQNQYGMETQIVAAMYAVLSFATIALGLQVPRIKDSRTQQIAVFIWALVLFGMYGFLMSIFRIKNGGYPFWLPPF